MVQDGSLRTAKKFNHKLRDKYILQIRVFDNGTPPLFSDTYGTKNIRAFFYVGRFFYYKIFGIWREVLGHNVYITSQYFFPAIIYRDIISHITITYRYIMYFFRTFKKSTAPYKVHNMGLR